MSFVEGDILEYCLHKGKSINNIMIYPVNIIMIVCLFTYTLFVCLFITFVLCSVDPQSLNSKYVVEDILKCHLCKGKTTVFLLSLPAMKITIKYEFIDTINSKIN